MNIEFLRPEDRKAWEELARGYKDFYKKPTSDQEFDTVWQRLLSQQDVFGLGARVDGNLLGIAHYLYHTTVWEPRACYMQDLFTAPQARGRGLGKGLIEAVAAQAEANGANRFYWMTQQDNATARFLYDSVAKQRGFIRYEYDLVSPKPPAHTS